MSLVIRTLNYVRLRILLFFECEGFFVFVFSFLCVCCFVSFIPLFSLAVVYFSALTLHVIRTINHLCFSLSALFFALSIMSV